LKIVVIRLKNPYQCQFGAVFYTCTQIGLEFNQPCGYATFCHWQSIPTIMACLQCHFKKN
jgi:hypothetical protein